MSRCGRMRTTDGAHAARNNNALLVAVTSGPDGLRICSDAKDTAAQRVELAIASCAGSSAVRSGLQGINELMKAVCV